MYNIWSFFVYSVCFVLIRSTKVAVVSNDKTDGSQSLGKIMWEKRHWGPLWNVVIFFINTFLIYHLPLIFFHVDFDVFWWIDRINGIFRYALVSSQPFFMQPHYTVSDLTKNWFLHKYKEYTLHIRILNAFLSLLKC